MDQIDPSSWAVMHLAMILLITCVQMVIVYALSDSSNPTPGLGLYTVYFMAALLGWLAFTLQQAADIPMAIDVPSVAAILNSYILFIAAGARAERTAGRVLMGIICLAACLSVFFVSPSDMFAVQSSTAAFFFLGVGVLCFLRGREKRNTGDFIGVAAGLTMVIGIPIVLYQALVIGDVATARALGTGIHSIAFVMISMGFLASVLLEYQQHLSHVATQDPLTRLLNRRGLESALHVTFAQSARQQLLTSAIMVDIDRLKEINDNFGQDIGDQVIRQVAQYLQRISRSSDVLARTGGNEYLMILPDTALEDARGLAERIRTGITAQPIVANQQHLAITISLGVAAVQGGVDLDKLSSEANRALRQAKHGGSNRVASVENKPIHMRTTASEV
ncbi:MAG: GGDEF domain-containing protein [Halioglobus sp.]